MGVRLGWWKGGRGGVLELLGEDGVDEAGAGGDGEVAACYFGFEEGGGAGRLLAGWSRLGDGKGDKPVEDFD